MSTVGKLQAKLAELLQINEAAVTHIESLASERDYFKIGMTELQDIIDKLEAERDALAASNHLLNALIASMQNAGTEYLQPDGDADEFIGRVIYLLDGPEQRAAQAAPQQCLREIQAEAARNGFIAGYGAGHEYRFSNLGDELADEYAERVKRGEQ